jgi:hypothetical protein
VSGVKSLALERGWNYTIHQPEADYRFQASKTTLAGFRDFIANGPEWMRLRDEDHTQGKRPPASKPFGRLYSVSEYDIPESFTCEISNALVIGPEGLISSERGEVIVDSRRFQGDIGARIALTKAQPDMERIPPTFKGSYVSLRAFATSNYCHWVLDSMPRLSLLGNSLDDVKFIMPTPVQQFHLDSLRAFGLADSQLVQVSSNVTAVEQLKFILATPKPNRPHPAHLLAMTERIQRNLLGEERPSSKRRVYIAREKTERLIVNENELLPILGEFGFEVIYCERLTFEEQVRLFAETQVIFGAHGAGMCNHIFCPPNAVVIELYQPLFWQDNVHRYSVFYDQPHWHLFGTPVDDGGIFNMRVEPERVRELLALACTS